MAGEKVGGWHATRAVARWGCFLPDLTRLASGSSTTNLPRRHIVVPDRNGKPEARTGAIAVKGSVA
ncbi:hypothetical protein K32_48080 [Kaistia sp. 32K]|nr:hypothetical protein K32_48080 [Kaistia sp. 32K]